ncbi:EpsG family protein [Capnocytophaga cynodegmi]|uniref:EpsG family protein n=1 Tax=Capnocytophaga cynodegmi TaxID=28189 RepID=UPI00385E95F8
MKLIIKRKLLLFLLLSIFVSSIVGNRGATRDTEAYYSVFKNIKNLDLLNPLKFYIVTGMEIGFGWYSFIISLFTNSNFILFFVFSFLTFYIIYKISEKITTKYIFVILLYLSSGYFFLQQFMQIRQGLATPLALYAVALFVKENRISLKFTLLSLLSISFHQVALPVILMGISSSLTFTREREISINKFRILCVVGLVIFVFLSKVFLSSILINLSSRVETYSKSAEYAAELGLFRLPNIKAFFTYLFILFFMNEKAYQNKLFVVFFVLFTLGLAFRIGFSDFAILSGRFATAFSFTEIFLLPFIFNRFKQGKIMFALFIATQAIATYVYQAPFIIEDYFKPLN